MYSGWHSDIRSSLCRLILGRAKYGRWSRARLTEETDQSNPDVKIAGKPFLIVLYVVTVFGFLTLLAAIFMSVFADTSDEVVRGSVDKLWTAFFSCLSAVIGLLGGKALP